MLKMIVTLNILNVIPVRATGINYHIVQASAVQAPTSIGLVQLNHGPFDFECWHCIASFHLDGIMCPCCRWVICRSTLVPIKGNDLWNGIKF